MKISVELDEEQIKTFDAWTKEQNSIAVKKQRESRKVDKSDPFYLELVDSWNAGYPYCGAIGGEITWMITNTSLGFVIKVMNSHTNNILDLTDYESW